MRRLLPFLFLVVLITSGCDSTEPAQQPESAPAAAKTKVMDVEQKLVGKWLRPDGGYVLEISKVGKQGRAEAMYFNPNPINVESALVTEKKGQLHLRVVLRDQNYDGSTYELVLDPAKDELTGTYFSPNAGQTYQVYFQRMKAG